MDNGKKTLHSAQFQDRVSSYFDFVFVIGFAILTILLPFDGFVGLKEVCLEIFYLFWTVFMLLVAIKNKSLLEECAFVDDIGLKSLFYIFLSSFAFNDLLNWKNDLIGAVFIAMSVINVIRCRRGKKNDLVSLQKDAKEAFIASTNDDHF